MDWHTKQARDFRLGGSVMREKRLTPSRCSFWKWYPLVMCYLLSLTSMLNLSFSLLNEMHNLMCILKLFDTWSFSIRMSLKWPLSKDSQFNIHSYSGWQENWGSSQDFHRFPFSKDHKTMITDQHVKPHLLRSHTNLKIKQFKSKHGRWKMITKIN